MPFEDSPNSICSTHTVLIQNEFLNNFAPYHNLKFNQYHASIDTMQQDIDCFHKFPFFFFFQALYFIFFLFIMGRYNMRRVNSAITLSLLKTKQAMDRDMVLTYQ